MQSAENLWSGRQWCVTKRFGLHGLPGTKYADYQITPERLGEFSMDQTGILSWPKHMAKKGCDFEDFLDGFQAAILVWGEHFPAEARAALRTSIDQARLYRSMSDRRNQIRRANGTPGQCSWSMRELDRADVAVRAEFVATHGEALISKVWGEDIRAGASS